MVKFTFTCHCWWKCSINYKNVYIFYISKYIRYIFWNILANKYDLEIEWIWNGLQKPCILLKYQYSASVKVIIPTSGILNCTKSALLVLEFLNLIWNLKHKNYAKIIAWKHCCTLYGMMEDQLYLKLICKWLRFENEQIRKQWFPLGKQANVLEGFGEREQ